MTRQDPEKVLLAIPARGGSKRLRLKNVLDIAGKPMIVHTIEAAIGSGLANSVYVCTEDDQIAEIASDAGAQVFRIPTEMTGDDVSSTTPVLSLEQHLVSQGLLRQNAFVFNLQPTSPLRSGADISGCMATLERSGANFAVSVTEIDPHYFHWALIDDGDSWRMYFNDEFLKERIYLPAVMRPNGAIKAARSHALRQSGHFFGKPLAVFPMPEERSIHVATEFDLTCVRAIATQRKQESVE